ncbi:MAG: hypothetical protein HFG02_07800 [Oscillibacter sp.]|nr:hypothetical protein [Oscillibacter sp.]
MSDAAACPRRRVGTLTLGAVLVAAGSGMLASLLWPGLELSWLLKLSPLILVALGTEVLLSARKGGKIRYDWAGMLLCLLLVGAGLTMYAAAWYVQNGEYFNAYNCSRYANEASYRMEYSYFDGFDSHTLPLEAGDRLEGRIDTYSGWLEVEVAGEDGNTLLEGVPLNGEQSVEVPRSGLYTVLVHGRRASGCFFFEAVKAPEAGAEPSAPEEAIAPEEADVSPDQAENT